MATAAIEWLRPHAGELPRSPGALRLTIEPPLYYPGAMVNITNRCNLKCEHCFVYRDGNPNEAAGEMSPGAGAGRAEAACETATASSACCGWGESR